MTDLQATIDQVFGDRIRESEHFASEVWGALCNTDWTAPDGSVWNEGFRSAGSVIAEIRDDGSDYMTWYCSGTAGDVAPEISAAMDAVGWTHQPIRLSPATPRQLWSPGFLKSLFR